MRYKLGVGAAIFIFAMNIAFSVIPVREIAGLIKYSSKFSRNERKFEVERYSGYDNVVQFVKNGDRVSGNSVIINTLEGYSPKFSELYNFSYLSNNKVFYAPIYVAADVGFFESSMSRKMIILSEENVTAYYDDSLFANHAYPLESFVRNDTLVLKWQYPAHNHMRLYICDAEGWIIFSMPIPADAYGATVYEKRYSARTLGLVKGHIYYWTVSKMSKSNFMLYSGRLRYD